MALSICNSACDSNQKELLQHGTQAFPAACYLDDLAIVPVPWHWHEEWEIILVVQGTAVVLLENAQVTLQSGDGLFINAGALHAIDSQHSRDGVLHSMVVHPRLIGGSVDSVYWQQLVQPLADKRAPRYVVLHQEAALHSQMIETYHRAWQAIVQEEDDHENLARYLLSRMVGQLNRHCIQASQAQSAQERIDAERIRTMLAYIDENITGELDTARIAESALVSQSVCLRCFHRMLGTTPIQYVKQARLDKAAQLLRSTSMTAKAVALACGFADVSYFTKAFREKMGVTPREYQNRR